MRQNLLTLSLIFCATLLSACATMTPYAPIDAQKGQAYGYEHQKLEETRYRILFRGNSFTSRQTVEDYLLFRAAELTLEQGFDGFEVVTRATDETKQTQSFHTPSHYRFSYRYYRLAWSDWGPPMDADTITSSRFEASAEIILFKGTREKSANVYDAKQLIENLSPRIKRPVTPAK